MPVAIIVGASSGIGEQLSRQLSAKGYTLGLVARREPLLRQLASELPGVSVVEALDVSQLSLSRERLRNMFDQAGPVDLFIYCAGVGFLNPDLDPSPELATIAVNVAGFANAINVAAKAFEHQGYGHIVGISSITALRGGSEAPAYGASKAFMSNYLEAIRCRLSGRSPSIRVTDVRPGFVDTAMAKGDVKFRVASPEKAARQILGAIDSERWVVYVTKRWRLVAWLMKGMPSTIWFRRQQRPLKRRPDQ
jgi:short-subunit dehydrogenase